MLLENRCRYALQEVTGEQPKPCARIQRSGVNLQGARTVTGHWASHIKLECNVKPRVRYTQLQGAAAGEQFEGTPQP